ncbi:amidase [Pseudoclavibacter sp. Z016]|uniref:amidase n=1 Tax=Pseudoclavibacter sp. Z016 TaxID=2080581 RepID=UPI000CE740C9|nr:amidase [Pseudoclavibacter sp. Z016]PPF76104.1 amidase [Pseudoclavibacter sp. Z016]
MSQELHTLGAVRQRQLLASGELSPVALTSAYLARLDADGGASGAFITVTADRALERARALEREPSSASRRGDRHEAPLWGMPFADKDLEPRADVPTSFGSRAFAGYVPEESSPLVETMDAAGGISLGKTNTPEFGLPAYTENAVAPPAVTPWGAGLGAGGSSGGAAAAVAAGLIPFAPGSDGGGSIRIPASACGLVGLKPSRGRVPDGSGVGSLAGLPVSGPIARSTADAALLLDGMIARRGDGSQADRSALTAPAGERSYLDALDAPLQKLRIGVNCWSPWSTEYEIALDDDVAAVFEAAKEQLSRLGHELVPVTPTDAPEYFDAFRTVWQAGASTIPLEGPALETLEPLTRWLVGVGRTKGAAELAASLASLAAFERSIIHQYSDVDVVLTPTLAMTPRPLGWFDAGDGERNFEQQCQYTPYTSYVNVTGLPAITMPVGFANGLPAGVQAIGRPGDEATLLRLSLQLEREIDWPSRYPPAWDGAARP